MSLGPNKKLEEKLTGNLINTLEESYNLRISNEKAIKTVRHIIKGFSLT